MMAVADERHFGRAAARLHMTQPPLSRAIRQLETDLGVTLLHRSATGVELTAAGTALYEEAGLLLERAERLRARVTVAADVTLTIGTLGDGGEAGTRLAEAENVSFAIAIDEALPVIERIRNQIPEAQTWFGAAFNSVDSDSAAVQLGLDASVRGAAITVVHPGGSGEDADLAVGDVIIAADDVPIDSAADLAKLLATRKPGDELDLELIDSRGPRLATVTLTKRTAGSLP